MLLCGSHRRFCSPPLRLLDKPEVSQSALSGLHALSCTCIQVSILIDGAPLVGGSRPFMLQLPGAQGDQILDLPELRLRWTSLQVVYVPVPVPGPTIYQDVYVPVPATPTPTPRLAFPLCASIPKDSSNIPKLSGYCCTLLEV